MAGPIATLRVLLTGDDAELRKKLKSSDKKTRDWAKNQIKHTKRVRQAFKMGAAAVGATAVAYAGLTRAAIKSADHLAKTADKIGVTVEGLQELRFAADRAGVDVRKFDMGLQRFARRLGEAQQGTGILQKELQALGIQLRNNDGSLRTTEAVLGDYADAIKAAQTPQEQLRLAFKAFDSEGAALVNMLKDGSAGLDDMRQKATDLGLVMGESTARKAEQLSDQFGTLSDVFQNKLNTALVESAHENWPAIVSAMDSAESAMYRMKQVMHLATAGVHVLRSGIAHGAAGMIAFGRSIADGVTKGVHVMGIQMQIMSQKVKLGVLRAVNAATSAGDAALSKAPEFVKTFFGYQSGDLSAGTDAMIANAETAIAELQGKLATARSAEDSQPSLIEQALLGVAGDADAAVEVAVAKAFEAQQRIDEIKANGGTATQVSASLGFGGDPAAGGDGSEDAKPKEVAYHEKMSQMILDNEKMFQGKMADLRASATSQGLTQLGQYVKGHTVAGRAILFAQKAMAVKQILMSGQVAIMKAWESGPIMGAVQAAVVAGQLAQALNTTKGVGVQGQFHDGIDNVPNTGTYLLEKGERVVDRRLNEDLTQALAAGGGGVGGGSNNLSINVNGISDAETINRVINEQRPQFEQMLRDINSDNAGQGLL